MNFFQIDQTFKNPIFRIFQEKIQKIEIFQTRQISPKLIFSYLFRRDTLRKNNPIKSKCIFSVRYPEKSDGFSSFSLWVSLIWRLIPCFGG